MITSMFFQCIAVVLKWTPIPSLCRRSAGYHIALTKSVGHMYLVVDGGCWGEFGHFETHMIFSAGRKKYCYTLKLVVLHVF